MPYISTLRRSLVDTTGLSGVLLTTGDLNYLITKAIKRFVQTDKNESYNNYNLIIGWLASLELEISQMVRFAQNYGVSSEGGVAELFNTITGYLNLYIDQQRKVALETSHRPGGSDRPDNWAIMVSLRGVLRCVELELYRRMVAPYEDLKITENGDV